MNHTMRTPARIAPSTRTAHPWALVALSFFAFALTAPVTPALAQPNDPPGPPLPEPPTIEFIAAPDDPMALLAPAVKRQLQAGYLSDDERLALRLRHGVWTDDDLKSTAARAAAALNAGAYESPALDDPAADPLDRAEALLLRGEPRAALDLLDAQADASPFRAGRVRAAALEHLGLIAEAVALATSAADRLRAGAPNPPAPPAPPNTAPPSAAATNADEAAEAARLLIIRRRLAGPELRGGRDDESILRLLRDARERLDPLSWRVRVVEAELLLERGELAQAGEAAGEALTLNPRSAQAQALLGLITVYAFALDDARAAADRLDRFAAPFGVASPMAELIRARADLRSDNTDRAVQTTAALLERLPGHRQAAALHAAAAFASFDDQLGSAALERFDALAPGHPLALYEAGAALAEQRQYDQARLFLRAAADRLPTWAQPWLDLGLLEIQAGRDRGAQEALTHALELDAYNDRATNSLALVEAIAPWPEVQSEHFRVRYREGPDAVLAAEMLPVLEDIHRRVTAPPELVAGGFDHEPAQPTLIELMPGHRWFSVRITGNTRVHTIAAATGPVISMESPRQGPGFRNGPFDWPRVLQHEYAHTVTLSRTKNRIPHWFTEAAAVNVEDAPRAHDTWALLLKAFDAGELFDLDRINIAFVRPTKPTDRAQAYAQGHWMYQFIVHRFGPRAPLDLMDRYAQGTPEARAFEAVLGIDRQAFMADFLAWAEDDLRSSRLLPPRGAPRAAGLIAAARDAFVQAGGAADDFSLTPDQVDRWLADHPGHPELLGLAAELALRALGDTPPQRLPEDVARRLSLAAEARPTDDAPRRLLARHHLAADDPAEHDRAVPHLEFLDAREQSTPAYAVELALIHADRRRLEPAAQRAERAVRISPFDADHRELAASIALLRGDVAQAERHILALTMLEPAVELHQRRLRAVREFTPPAQPRPQP